MFVPQLHNAPDKSFLFQLLSNLYDFFIMACFSFHKQFVIDPDAGFATAERAWGNSLTPVTPDKSPIEDELECLLLHLLKTSLKQHF